MQDIENFPLSLEECKLILDNIDGLVATDENGKIIYISQDMRGRISSITGEELPEDVYGSDIKRIHPASKIIDMIESGTKAVDRKLEIYLALGFVNVARLKKMYGRDGHMGYVDIDLFGNAAELQEFFDKLKRLSRGNMMDFTESIDLITTEDKRIKDVKYTVADILGKSKKIEKLKESIYSIADFDSTILIEAETGCGKELVTHSIHNLSRRRKGPLVEINCAAIPESLFESELFGYEEGTFTGAQRGGKAGKLELAEKGTLFLDEIDQLPYHIQPKLLRVLQEHEFSRIGGKVRKMDVRIIAASNKNLAALVREGRFREDLYYRLNVIKFTIPPLRERKDDIILLMDSFIEEMNQKLDKEVKGVTPEVMKVLYSYKWPGNIRELKNLIERAMYMCKGKRIELKDLGDFISEMLHPNFDEKVLDDNNPLEKAKELAEAKVIEEALKLCDGNKRKAAELLKISRATLYNKLEKLKKMSK